MYINYVYLSLTVVVLSLYQDSLSSSDREWSVHSTGYDLLLYSEYDV